MTLNNHDSDIDVVHKYNHVELKGWVDQLQYIDREIDNLLSLYANSLGEKSIPAGIQELFSERKKLNKELYEKVLPYSITYTNVAECDDIQCDMAYLGEYDRLRENYKDNLEAYQQLKDKLFEEALRKE
ncbi:hypothetical protein C8N26_2605 [Tenacibaculum lutimaris]|uniref:Uncharacterized protein n=1 Tax=Tenacibaculum lutimaris TaxID=285258 RepID=A0A420DY70_9FLAO|nr:MULTISPECIES: hypothetical protein [Tenacibaculum]RKF02759.1 hypothetical protein C8N26_2605 [Tenacibaculum lutimaris]